jgi:hypothetical protein
MDELRLCKRPTSFQTFEEEQEDDDDDDDDEDGNHRHKKLGCSVPEK